jgi:hypothetical protein
MATGVNHNEFLGDEGFAQPSLSQAGVTGKSRETEEAGGREDPGRITLGAKWGDQIEIDI